MTAALVRVKEAAAPLGQVAEALDANRRLWACSPPIAACPRIMPLAVRGQIISLAMWVARYSSQVLREGAEIDPLIDVNRTMMEGLSAS